MSADTSSWWMLVDFAPLKYLSASIRELRHLFPQAGKK
jgi:hypothetical protein